MKIFPVKNVHRPTFIIDKSISESHLAYINQAKGVIENYLKDKTQLDKVCVKEGDIFGCKNMLSVSASNSKCNVIISFLKDSDTPFLRKVYNGIQETVAEICKRY